MPILGLLWARQPVKSDAGLFKIKVDNLWVSGCFWVTVGIDFESNLSTVLIVGKQGATVTRIACRHRSAVYGNGCSPLHFAELFQ